MEEIKYENIPLDGIIDSPVDLRDYNYNDFCCDNEKIELPDEFHIEYPFEVRNQKETGTCVFQAISAVIETINNIDDYVSDGFLNAMRDENDCQLGTGAVTREIMKLACNIGTIPKKDFPNLEDYPEISDSFDKINNKKELIDKAKLLKCLGFTRVNVEDIPRYIFKERKPIIITTKLYDSFYRVHRPSTDGVVEYPSNGGRCGNHAMGGFGFKKIKGDYHLDTLNSWGKKWALNGHCYINLKDDKLINEVWAFIGVPKRVTTTKYDIGWNKDKDKWTYSEDGQNLFNNGWKEIKGEWYYFKDNFAINGDWIFDNSWYYLEQGSCKMIKDCWKNINGDWYIFNEKGKMITGWYKDKNNNWFYLDNNGKMKTGWIFEGGKWYYLNPNSDGTKGKMIIGWLKEGECWYYLDIDKGYCYTNCTILIDGKYYTFNEKGQLIENNSLVSDNLIEFIKGWESFYSKAYYDGYGNTDTYLTIGYGITKTANQSAFPNGINSTCTKEQATTWLKDEVNKCANKIKNVLGNTQISQNRFDCMVDISYNAGLGSLIGGNTWKALISGNKSDIERYLMQWNKANGIYSEGLNKRCRARVNMALYGVYNSTH
ncbi:glycoside hydrolase family protein [Clostridium botulinum]|uniref:glycoside hydrolase family protein n=1 Tax=Clostridium botulinum TaxID=1491 RepID=UPI001C9B768E|nr:glycoside hydrolase family protein [Clostridium botulinum]MBY6838621.1 glycoside hydrolase family protein [Clostridium botulinum]